MTQLLHCLTMCTQSLTRIFMFIYRKNGLNVHQMSAPCSVIVWLIDIMPGTNCTYLQQQFNCCTARSTWCCADVVVTSQETVALASPVVTGLQWGHRSMTTVFNLTVLTTWSHYLGRTPSYLYRVWTAITLNTLPTAQQYADSLLDNKTNLR